MHIRIANLKNITQEAIGFAHSDCQTGEAKPRQPSDMHIRIANLKKSAQEAIGYAHSDCQSKKLNPGNHGICTFGLPI